jgi:hypothetical protein
MDFYRTTISSIHARIRDTLIAAHAQPASLIPITSRVSCKTPYPFDNPACISEWLTLLLNAYILLLVLSLLCTLYRSAVFSLICRRPPLFGGKQAYLLPQCVAAFYLLLSAIFSACATILPQLMLRYPPPQQLRLFVAPNPPFSPFCRSCQVPHYKMRSTHFCSTTVRNCNNQTFYCIALSCTHHSSLIASLSLPGTRNFQLSTFFPANLVAVLAAVRHKSPISATKSACSSRIVAVVCHAASAAAAAATKKRTRFPIRFCLYSELCTLYSELSLSMPFVTSIDTNRQSVC